MYAWLIRHEYRACMHAQTRIVLGKDIPYINISYMQIGLNITRVSDIEPRRMFRRLSHLHSVRRKRDLRGLGCFSRHPRIDILLHYDVGSLCFQFMRSARRPLSRIKSALSHIRDAWWIARCNEGNTLNASRAAASFSKNEAKMLDESDEKERGRKIARLVSLSVRMRLPRGHKSLQTWILIWKEDFRPPSIVREYPFSERNVKFA